MTERKDDPREVLSLLNSLGFVGITAQQLKAFMKDLKIHRKIQEAERQQWKEETKRKILQRQQQLYQEVLREHNAQLATLNNHRENNVNVSSESSTLHDDSSCNVVTVKIRHVSKDKENHDEQLDHVSPKRKHCAKTHTSWAEEFRRNNGKYDDGGYLGGSSSSVNETHKRTDNLDSQVRNQSAGGSTDSTRYITLEKPKRRVVTSDPGAEPVHRSARKLSRSKSATIRDDMEKSNHRRISRTEQPEKPYEQQSEVSTHPPPSRSSVRSRSKSFIRPWRLQPDMHKSALNKKSDPVALYKKYQEEWKQLALPGEETHASLRWSIREKMLGLDPNPRPVLRTCSSTSTIKRR